MKKSSNPEEWSWSEDKLQIHIFTWFSNEYPEYHGLLFHVANQGRDGKQGKKYQFMGAVPGVADLLSFVNEPLAIELKKPDGTGGQSKPQKKWQAAWEKKGNRYVVSNDAQEIKDLLSKEVSYYEWELNQLSM